MTTATIRSRGLLGHLLGQATGAANDNLFRQAFAFAVTAAAIGEVEGNRLKAAMGLLFIVPFIALAPLAGRLADTMPKHLLVRRLRLAEVALCVTGLAALLSASVPLMLLTVAALGAQSALFAPVKYAILPEIVPSERLEQANGRLQALSNVAILTGTGLAISADGEALAGLGGPWTLGAVSLLLALTGVAAALTIPALPAAGGERASGGWGGALRVLREHRELRVPMLCLAAVWAVGAVLQLVLTGVAAHDYQLAESGAAGLALCLGLGLATGALLAPALHHRAYPGGLPAFGALVAGLGAVTTGLLAARGAPLGWTVGAIVATGIGGGLWIVPLNVLLQQLAPENQRGRVFACSSILDVLGIVVGFTVMAALGDLAGLGSDGILVVVGALTAAGAGALAWRYRLHVAAWLAQLLVRLAYCVDARDLAHLPRRGGCLVVCNHVSYADGLILFATFPRAIRSIVYRRFCDLPVIGLVLRAVGAIPIDGEGSRRALLAAVEAAIHAAEAGEAVLIFPEGKLSRSGRLDRFLPGMERIAKRAGVPIVPARLDGLYGTPASRAPRRRLPRLRRPVTLRLGAAMPPTTTAAEARSAVANLSYEEAAERASRDARTLGVAVLAQAKRMPRTVAVRDFGGSISYLKLAGAALVLRRLLGLTEDERRVGVLLPPGRAGAIVNLALALDGRTAVNLNHTVGQEGLRGMIEQAGLRSVVTARAYTQRIGEPELGVRRLDAEDLVPAIGKVPALKAMAAVLLRDPRALSRSQPDDVAALIFSSGSTGTPKGVQLTHRQLLAQFDAIVPHFALSSERDVLLSPLPLFHSMGYSTGLFFPLCTGLGVAAHPDPTDAKAIGRLAQESGASFLVSTATFVRGYLRRIEPEQFASLRFAVVGAEKCPQELRDRFRERYNAELHEGYGCTELGPVVSCNAPTVERDGAREVASKPGSVGPPLPGVEVVTMDPDSRELLPRGAEGLLVARSPSRMLGYLDRPDLDQQVFVHGGYDTGDVGYVDDEGFVHITGRLSRFAKIGGEMVPLEKIQETMLGALKTRLGEEHEYNLAVSAVSDETRGEKLVVLHDGIPLEPAEIAALADELTPLFRPRARDVHAVEELPKLGTGKLDLKRLRQLAEEVAG